MNPTIRFRGDGVHIVSYVYEAGTVLSEFADAFSDAVRRGVEVRIVIDRNGAKKIPAALLAAWTIWLRLVCSDGSNPTASSLGVRPARARAVICAR